MAPLADAQKLRTICDWGNWIFPFDDLFDDGKLREDSTLAQATMIRLLSVFDDNVPFSSTYATPIVAFHDEIWANLRAGSSIDVAERYQKAMRDYCTGALNQVNHFVGQKVPEPEEMLTMRRGSVCVRALHSLVEYGHQIDLPKFVFEDPTIQEIEIIGIDLTLLHNDVLSYRKEESEGVPHNLVATYRMRGLFAQDAMNSVGTLIQARHQSLERAKKRLPEFGTKGVNQEVSRYIKAIHDVVAANLYWSFKSGRFLSAAQKVAIKEKGVVDVLKKPSYVLKRTPKQVEA